MKYLLLLATLCYPNGSSPITAMCNLTGCTCPPDDQMMFTGPDSSGTVTITNTPAPSCDVGWTTVWDGSKLMCAKELKQPR